MQITNHLYQFSDRKSLLLAAGKQQARLYYCFDGTVDQIDSFKEPKPRYSDREGRFMRSGQGMVMGAGSVYEAKDDVTVRYFLQGLADRIKAVVRTVDFEAVYLFAPGHLSAGVQEALPKALREKIEGSFDGNYVDEHPFVLIGMIDEARKEGAVRPMRAEAKQILDKTDQARETTIKGRPRR